MKKPTKNLNRDHRAILALLRERGSSGATTTELDEVGYRGYRGRISELRHEFGHTIQCKYEGQTDDKRSIHRYFLLDARVKESDTPVCEGCKLGGILAWYPDTGENRQRLCLRCIDQKRKVAAL